ncbi:phosphoribosylanthranilate isomerase [Candidatus Woesearchaeota archaeon]|jgi:phosphoribosylanthranilate isomerase|nr:phosphoribosylanthranilate isomerase [Candidatus Woesearchaeota archaeon]
MTHPYPASRTRVKICGFTRPQDALEAARLGVDAIGLVFYEPSPRHLTIARAESIIERLPAFVTVVGLFVNARAETLAEVTARVRLDLIQFHGDETPADCEAAGLPYIKAVAVRPDTDWQATLRAHRRARGFLLDAWHPDARGGTGQRFDWNLIPAALASTCILAGGLTPDTVGSALAGVRPYALDVSSGVEAGKGIKDAAKMAAFLTEVSTYDYRKTS